MRLPAYQPAFSAGELSPGLHGRVDLAKYHAGARRIRNFLVLAAGGVANRPGTYFAGAAKSPVLRARLVRFQFDVEQTYVLEVGAAYIRVWRWDPATRLPGPVLYPAGHAFEGQPVEVGTPYTEAHALSLQTIQSADVLYLLHPDHPPRKLARYDHHDWRLEDIAFAPSIAAPTGLQAAKSDTGTFGYRYKVTASNAAGEESYAGREVGRSVTGAVQSDPAVLALADHGFVDSDEVYLHSFGGMTALNDRMFRVAGVAWGITNIERLNPARVTAAGHPFLTGQRVRIVGAGGLGIVGGPSTSPVNNINWTVTRVDANRFTLDGLDLGPDPGTGEHTRTPYTSGGTASWLDFFALEDEDATSYPAYTSGGFAERTAASVTDARKLEVNVAHVDVTWAPVAAAVRYHVYREQNGLFGYIGSTTKLTFRDDNIAPVLSDSPPRPRNPFQGAGNYPATGTIHEQRLVFAAPSENPIGLWMSRAGAYENFSTSEPLQDDDAITLTLAGREVNAIRHLVSLRSLVALTAGGEFEVLSDEGPLSPVSVRVSPQSYLGTAAVPPLVVGNTVAFVQEKGQSVRDLLYAREGDGYAGTDLSLLASHLFEGRRIVDWCYARAPHSVIWCVLDDGALLSLTYVRDQEVWAWARHDTGGDAVEAVCSVSEGPEDGVWLVVRRMVDAVARRYVERLTSRVVTDEAKGVFLDSALTYGGAVAVSEVAGLEHLEGRAVAALVDGQPALRLKVTGGAVTLPRAGNTIHVGLPITAEVQTLDLELAPEVRGKRRRVCRVVARVQDSRGLLLGPGPDDLMLARPAESARHVDGAPYSGEMSVLVTPAWGETASLWVRHVDPLPLTLLALAPEVDVGG